MRKALELAALARHYASLYMSLGGAAKPLERPPIRILFLGYAAVGDLVFLLPALKALREGRPKARIVFVGDDDLGARVLLPELGLVDEIWRLSHARMAAPQERAEFERRVIAEKFDVAVASLATPLRPFARALLRVPARLGQLRPGPESLRRRVITSEIERRWVFNRPLVVTEEDRHMADHHLDLVAALGLPVPRAADARPELPRPKRPDQEALRLLPDSPLKTVALHLGPPDNQYAKMWPPERWAQLARLFSEKWPCRLVVLGGEAERPSVERFRKAFPGEFLDFAGRMPLWESISVIRRCGLVLSSDTGISKLAMACRVPTASVWGPTSRKDNGAVWDPELHLEIAHPQPCPPRVRLGLPSEKGAPDHDCLERITPAMAFEAISGHVVSLGW